MFLNNVLDDVLINHHRIGGFNQRIEAIIDFGLAGSGDFVVLAFDAHAQFFHDEAHFGANVLLGISGADREITFLMPNLVAEVGHLFTASVPDGFFGIDGVEGAVALGIELDVVEDEEFSFRTEHSGISNAGAVQILLGALSQTAWVAGVGFLGAGLGDGAGQRQGGNFAKR